MRRKNEKALVLLFFTIIFILLMGLICFIYCNNKLELQEVCIAKYSLNNRTLISQDEIEVTKVPKSYLNENVILKKEDVVGKYVKINTMIPKGSFFYEDAIEEYENIKDKLNSELEDGEVNFDLNANNINVNQSYLVKGMYVDLYLTIDKNNKVLSDLLINNVRIIGMYDVNHQEIKDYDNKTILQSICLAVPKDTISYLYKAQVVGQLSVVVGNNSYKKVSSKLNNNADIFEYLK